MIFLQFLRSWASTYASSQLLILRVRRSRSAVLIHVSLGRSKLLSASGCHFITAWGYFSGSCLRICYHNVLWYTVLFFFFIILASFFVRVIYLQNSSQAFLNKCVYPFLVHFSSSRIRNHKVGLQFHAIISDFPIFIFSETFHSYANFFRKEGNLKGEKLK